MEEDVVPVTEDEVNFDPQDLLGDPARQEISQTSLEIMQLLAECEGGEEVFGNIHQGNFIYDSASLVGSSSELSDIFQDDSQIDIHSVHRLDDILVNSIDLLNKLSPKKKTTHCQEDSSEKKKPRNSKENFDKETSQKSSKSKINSSRRKKGIEGDAKCTRKRSVKSSTSDNVEAGKQLSSDIGNISSSPDITSSLHYEKNSKYKIGEDGTYTCYICGKKFTVLKSLQIHSTIHRQKVRLVRKSQSKEDSKQHRSRRESSTSTINNTPRRNNNAKFVHCTLVRSGNNKPAASVCDYGISPGCERLKLDLNRYNVCPETSPINDVCRKTKGKVSGARNFKSSGKSDFSGTRKGNTSCSKTLESLSRHGAKEYLTLSSKKSKKSKISCKTKTASNKSGDDMNLVGSSTAEKIAERQTSKCQTKSVIPHRQISGTDCNYTRRSVIPSRQSSGTDCNYTRRSVIPHRQSSGTDCNYTRRSVVPSRQSSGTDCNYTRRSVVPSRQSSGTDCNHTRRSVVPSRQSSGTDCNHTRKRNTSKRCSEEKQPMKRVCLLDRFRDDHSSESSDSVHLCTVDTDPNTNGGLLQHFDVDSSLKGSKKGGRTGIRIRRGLLVRKRTGETHKLSACESRHTFTGTSTGVTQLKKDGVIGGSSGREVSASTDSDKNSCVVSSSRGEATECNAFDQNDDQCKKIPTSQSTHTISMPSLALDSNSNLKCDQAICRKEQKGHAGKLHHADQMRSNNEGLGGDNTFQQHPEENSTKRKTNLPAATSGVLLQKRSDNEKILHYSQETEREGEALNCVMEDCDITTTVENQIPVTPNSIDDSHVDSNSKEEEEEVVMSFSDKGKLELEQTFSSNSSDKGKLELEQTFSSNSSDNGKLELGQTFSSNSKERRNKSLHGKKSEVAIGINMDKLSSCESKCLMLRSDNSEECYDCDGRNISDFNPSNSSDDESEPLVLYQQSCRTLPLCALLNLARRQKLVLDLSRSSQDVVIEKPFKARPVSLMTKCAQLSAVECELEDQQMTCCDENDLSGKTKNVSSLSQKVKDMSPAKMRELMSSYDKEVTTTGILVNLRSTDLSNDNAIEITSMSERILVDPQKSVSVSESATVSTEPQKSDKMPNSSGIFYKPHSSYQDNSVCPSIVQVESSSPLENTALSHCCGKRQGASLDKHRGEISDHHGNCLPQTLDTNRDNFLPLTEVVQCDGEQQGASPDKHQGEISDHHGNCLTQTLDTNRDNLLPLIEVVQCDGDQQGASLDKHQGEKSDHHGNCLAQTLDTNQDNLLPEVVQCDVPVGPCVGMEGCDMATQSKIRSDSDVQQCPKLSSSTDCTLSSLKSIADGNCIEVSRSILRRCSTGSEGDEEDMSVKAVTPEKDGENADNDIFYRNHPHVNVVDSDDFVDDSVNRCLDDSSLDHVSDRRLDDGSVSLEVIKSLDDHKDHDHKSSVTSSRYPDKGTSIYFLKESKLGFKPYQIEVQQNLLKNVMSTCNVVGTFADDMVTGMINVIDTETNSSDSTSVSSKFHDYCARQISYQNFLQWKLDENQNKELSQDNSFCARMLSFQAFHRTKSQNPLSSEKQFEGIPQLCYPTVLQGDECSGNKLTEIEQSYYSLEQATLTGSASQEVRNKLKEQPVMGSDNNVTRSGEQPEVASKGEQPVLDITVIRQRGHLLTTVSDGAISEGVCANIDSGNVDRVCASSEGDCANSVGGNVDGVCANNEGVCANNEGICANSDRVCAISEGVCTISDSVDSISKGVCVSSEGMRICAISDGVCANSDGVCTISEDVCANSCDYIERNISPVGNKTSLDSEDSRNMTRSYTPTVVSTGLNQNVSIMSDTSQTNTRLSTHQQTYLDYGYHVIPDNVRNLVSLRSEELPSDESESTEDDCDNHVYTNQKDTCARVQPFETNIMHKFSDKTKLLFQEYHDRQQNAMDISYSDTVEKGSRLDRFNTDIQTQTVSSLEENECSVYEMHMLGSVSSISSNSNSTYTQKDFKRNTGSDKSYSSFNNTFSASVNPRNIDDSMDSSCEGLTLKSDMVPFKSSMNIFNLEDISTSLLNRQNIVLSKEEQRYLKSPKKLWYRTYMGRISTTEEGRGDNPKTTFEIPSHQQAFVFPELRDSERHDDIEDELSSCMDHNTATPGKENTPEKNLCDDTRECSEPIDFNGQPCEAQNGEESLTLNVSIRQSDEDYASDTTGRFDVCSRMRKFRKRQSCARACRDGYLSGCARSRVFVKKTDDKS